ncbi:protein Shroom1 isoform X4 [Lagenorhynchus albirostris]|uniref:protein Shroom1 isoform X4 n=1 Tax=Lagenorhynchus albirostris TaxID=27610 RepID=UPI0028E4B26B|nr:protein Shroom1 isoform X4 [Lagenorhynchus albirostris]
MEALGPGGDCASPASSTRSLDLRRLSARADSAYSSFSAASGGPEPRTPSPGTHQLPYLDWDYVRVVWGGPAPTAGLRTSPQPRPAAAARSGPRPPEIRGTPGPLSRQTTPLLYALAAEAEAAARAAEPPSPPASRAAYRQRLQGAQRRVLRETSFQRKELRMSLPARLRPAAPARPSAAHPRSALLSQPGGEAEPARPGAPAPVTAGRGRLANQQRQWCFSEPGKLDRVGRGGGLTGECSGEACSSSGLARPEPREWQQRTLAEFEGHQIRWLLATQPRSIEDPKPRSLRLSNAYRPAGRSQSASGEVLSPWGSPGGVMPIAQAVPQGAETPRPLFQTKLSSPEPSLGLLDGLIPLAEVWAAMRPACGEAGEEAAGTSASSSYLLNSTQRLPASQKETRPENLTTYAVPDEPCGPGLPEPNNSIQAKKVELADLLQKTLRELQAEQEQLQGAAQAWARRGAALEAAVGQACAPHELERFSRFMADIERVLGLLLLLGSRLDRVHRALARAGADGDPDEQASLLQRLGLLQRQQEDAKELKQHVARRERALREVLARALPADELRAYRALLVGKAAVLAQQRSLDERVRLLQDQLDTVRTDLGRRPATPRPAWPPGTRPPDKPPFPPPLI